MRTIFTFAGLLSLVVQSLCRLLKTHRWLSLGILLLTGIRFSCPAQVIITEFMADNKNVLADEDGDYPDWIELYNSSSTNVNLEGWSLSDSNNRWYFPATNLTTKGYLVVFASGKNRRVPGAPLHADFSLNASGEYLGLLTAAGTVASDFSPAFPEQEAEVSYGAEQRGATNSLVLTGATGKVLIPANADLGANWTGRTFNDSGWQSATTGIGYQTAVAGFAVYNYLANVSVCSYAAALGVITNPAQQLAVYSENPAVINYFNASASAHYGNDAPFPGLTLGTDRDNFAVEATATIYLPAAGTWTFGVNSDDGFSLTVGGLTVSYPNPRGPGDSVQAMYFPAAGAYPLRLVYYECGGGAEVELWAAQGSYSAWDTTNFRLVGDTLNGGLEVSAPAVSSGTGGISYAPRINTDLEAQMNGLNPSAYLRVPFNLTSAAALQSLAFRVQYDDGFILWLNGRQVVARNAPSAPSWNSAATASHLNVYALQFEEINLSDHLNALQDGQNLLAIQGLNVADSDTDFLIVPELREYRTTNGPARFFSTASPGAINGTGSIAVVADTKFSVDRGFFDAPFSLSITTATANATIIYTTNGSVPSLTNGLPYAGALLINGTRVIRAAAFRDGYLPSDVDTQTYLFLSDVVRQSTNGAAPPGWPTSWGANVVDYGMDPEVVNNPLYSTGIIDDLKSLPSFSIVTELNNLFDPATGIYANASQDGRDWERPASLELLHSSGKQGFQANCGLRIRGGFSRSSNNPKHAFRVFFRQEYGDAKLAYPVFESQEGAEEFDGFDLRTFQNYSWSYLADYRFIGLRDQFSRDTQVAQGQLAERGDFCHLYINGQYWGVYNTAERPEASFSESYLGGTKENYDVVKVESGLISATDGNLEAWLRLWQAATNGFTSDLSYFKVQGLNLNGTRNPAYENLVDVDNLIDYMLLIFLTGNIDAPITAFGSDAGPNNFYAVRNRTDNFGGFRFLAHDAEHTLLHESSLGNTDEIHRDRIGPFPAGDPVQQGAANAFNRSNPGYVFSRLAENLEFRLRVADRVHKYFFNGGLLTTENMRSRLLVRSNEIYRAVVAESARWGDAKRAAPFTRNIDWVTELNRVYGNYFEQRPGIVLGQLRAKNLFPGVAAPSFNQFGGVVTNGFRVSISAPAGTIYYTTDGSDPRLRGGAVSQKAMAYSGQAALTQSTTFKARVLNAGVWSALAECSFYIVRDLAGLLITEVMYHPPDTFVMDGDAFEFIELKNAAGSSLDLSGVQFTNGITFRFPVGTILAPGQFVVLVSDPAAFTNKYPAVPVAGAYQGRLQNSGERVAMVQVNGAPVSTLEYGTRPPWPMLADGGGFSLVPINPNLNPDPDSPLSWRSSSMIGGSPGTDDPPLDIPHLVINEALTHTDLPQLDTIEIHNPHGTNASIGGWYLTDDRTTPVKYRIPAGLEIPAYGYRLFTEHDWNADPQSTNSFRLDSHGEAIYLYSANTNGSLTGYSDGMVFGAAGNGVAFGRYTNSVGEIQFPAQIVNTLPGANWGPRVGPVVINEIHYHPAAGGDEFIEIKSVTNQVVKLYHPLFPTNTWRLNGIGFDFPQNTEIPPDSLVLIAGIDPAAFRLKYGVPTNVPIFGPFAGTLQGSGEALALQFPDAPDLQNGTNYIPYIDADVVRYNDKAPWPVDADGFGSSLERLDATMYGNDPINWRASPGTPSPGFENLANRPPSVNAGPDQTIEAAGSPFALALPGIAADDGSPSPLEFNWSLVSGPGTVWFNNSAQTNTVAYFPGIGSYTLRLTATDGLVQVSDEVTFTIQHSRSEVTFVPRGSIWNYLDDGTDQGTAWRARVFNDNAWASGPAPLGYNDANGQWPATTNSFGTDSSGKHLTYYYRHYFTVANPASVTNLLLSVQRDDGVIVYLNGTGILTNNLATGVEITYLSNALQVVGGTDETAIYTQPVNPALLLAGTNVLAAEVHQSSRTSSDLIFDCGLVGEGHPVNLLPTVQAGPDLSITLPAEARLRATIADDGLPIPPGLLTFAWTKVSGPGVVTFAEPASAKSTASFSVPGDYVLRFAASDGSGAATDDLSVTVAAAAAPLVITFVAVNGSPPTLRLHFEAAANISYTVQYCTLLAGGTWQRLVDIPAQGTARSIEIADPEVSNSAGRFYRVVSPLQP